MYSRAQKNAIIFVPIVAGSLSSISSLALIASIIRSKVKLDRAVRRIIFGFCTYDVVYSMALNLATFVAPKNEALYAIGNIGTCDAQGFFIYVGYLGSVLYNASLAIYYVCTIQFSLSEIKFRKRIEPFCHFLSNVSPIATGIFLLVQQSFNLDGRERFCYISATPKECLTNDDIQCERGSKKSVVYEFWFSVIPFAIAFIIIMLSMFTIIISVIKQKRSSDRWRMSGGSDNSILMNVLKWCFRRKEQRDCDQPKTAIADSSTSKIATNCHVTETMHQTSQAIALPTTTERERTAKQVQMSHLSLGDPASSSRRASNASDPHPFDLQKMRASKVAVTKKKLSIEEDSKKVAEPCHSSDDGYDEELQILRTAEIITKPKVAPSRSGTKEDPLKFDLRSVRQSICRESLVAANTTKGTKMQSTSRTSLRTLYRSTKNKDSSKRRSSNSSNEERAANQCLLYIGSFLFCYIVPVIQQFAMYKKEEEPPFALALIGVTTIPLQGFLMTLVYTRPYVRSMKNTHPEYSWLKRFVEVIKSGGDQD